MSISTKLFSIATIAASSLYLICHQQVDAHVTAMPNTRDASAPSGLTQILVPHSCIDKSGATPIYYPTIGIEAHFPETITTALPGNVAGWDLKIIENSVTTTTGATAVQRIFNWTIESGGLTTKELGLFPVYWSVPSSLRASNQKFYFPVIQYCQNGTVSLWTLTSSNSSTSEGTGAEAAPVVNYSATTPSATQTAVSSSSGSWGRSDTLSIAAIILSAISTFIFVAYALKKFLDSDLTDPLDKESNYQAEKKLVA